MATLLIVEDDIDTNEAVCEYLQEAGHSTISALTVTKLSLYFQKTKLTLLYWILCYPQSQGWPS